MNQICKVREQEIVLDVEANSEQYRADTYESKEPETLTWIERYFSRGDVFYDLGANIGLYSLYSAKILKGKCKIYAFEPEALNYAKLNKNIILNSFSGIIIPCCIAISDHLSFDIFNLHPMGFELTDKGKFTPGSALHCFGSTIDFQGENFTPFHTQGNIGVSLDYLIYELNCDFPDHIKIDVDGHEEKVINGSLKTINDKRLKTVLIEISESEGEKKSISCLLEGAGLVEDTNYQEHSSAALKGTPFEMCHNTIFVRKD
jgi:FkbM family methyltransferase